MLRLILTLCARSACHPRLPPVSGCVPAATRCSDAGEPQVCSASQRWEPAGDAPCSDLGAVCVVDDRGAHCARVRDAGAIGGDL